jgi:hypothetical protein
MARHPYPMTHVRLRQKLQLGQIQAALAEAANPPPAAAASAPDGGGGGGDGDGDGAGKKGGGKKGGGGGGGSGGLVNLKGVVGGLLPYGPGIAEHVLVGAGLDPSRVPGRAPLADPEVAALFRSVQQLEAWFAGLEGEAAPAGFITTARAGGPSKRQRAKAAAAAAEREKAAAAGGGGGGGGGDSGGGAAAAAPDGVAAAPAADAPATAEGAGGGGGGAAALAAPAAAAGTAAGEGEGAVVYEDFNPLRLAQSAGDAVIEFDCFDDALDEFYSKVPGEGGRWGNDGAGGGKFAVVLGARDWSCPRARSDTAPTSHPWPLRRRSRGSARTWPRPTPSARPSAASTA